MFGIIEWVGLLSLPAFILLDLVYQAHTYTTPRGWRLKAFTWSALIFLFTWHVGGLWGTYLSDFSLIRGAELGVVGGSIVGILTYELVHYAYHRAAHRYSLLWRNAHQMHHSAESMDALGAMVLHPLDAINWTTLPILVFYPVLGLGPEAAAIATTFVAFCAAFQHANIRTPQWLGYLIQRPESHVIHHARGMHRSNYSDLPLWDIVFGTFDNPKSVDHEVGFYLGASQEIIPMLLGKDLTRPKRVASVPHESIVHQRIDRTRA